MNRRDALKRTAGITGMAVTASAGIGLLNGCQPSGEPDWQPGFLTTKQVRAVSAISDVILPTTNTPGAIDLHVPEFIDLMLKDNYSFSDQTTFLSDLDAFHEKVKDTYSSDFHECTPADKQMIMEREEDLSKQAYRKDFKKSFYLTVKELTILGYYTSEYVMNNMLDYHPVPGRYEGCIPLEDEGKVFVDNNV